ncbi:MAG TPA: LuxR C-terminal-related transcriptional regulator [Rhodothermales bacterium]|nr:LuxR C-terminal-related transcriptional regulator [Rhodothermales bacterium]
MSELAKGRNSFERGDWRDAYSLLSRANETSTLGAADLERLGMSAYLIGLDREFHRFVEHAHRSYVEDGRAERAARSAFTLALDLFLSGETGKATGWLNRARRLIEGRHCVEHGYLDLPLAERQLSAGDPQAAHETASGIHEIGVSFGDVDLISASLHLQGRALIAQGRVEAGLALLDEAMLEVVEGNVSPIFTGLIYCSVIEACREVYALGRAHEWTNELTRWCDGQPDLIRFTGACYVDRAEIMRLQGDWLEAMSEADRACRRSSQSGDPAPPAEAYYQVAELHRLRGQFEEAEDAYRHASRIGFVPQPGLALLRLAQNQGSSASSMIQRALHEATRPLERAKLLPACVEIRLAAGDLEQGRMACRELEEIADRFDTGVLRAISMHARGAVELAEGDPETALVSLRRASEEWKAPYEVARIRELTGWACLKLDDEEGAGLEFDAARAVYEKLGAEPDLARLSAVGKRQPEGGVSVEERKQKTLDESMDSERPNVLTPREFEVLHRVAAGKTNKEIASELFLSERTIDRHVSSILTKFDVPSRAAATAYAYEHKIL